jgi:hypothetical protein
MSNLNQIIDYTKTFQDVELATAIGELKKDPTKLQQFLQDQQSKVYNDILKQKSSTFEKVYGDLNRASQAQEAVVMLDKRNQELANIQKELYNNQKKKESVLTEDKNLTGRKYEMNQWTINNRKETLFIYSMCFIMLSALTLITVLWRMGIISTSLWVGIAAPIIIIFVLTIVNRTQYTNIFRNKRYWNRKVFEGKYGKIPIPSLCPDVTSAIQGEYDSMKLDVQQSISDAGQATASGMQNIAVNIGQAAQGISASTVQNAAPASIPAAAPITN